MIAELESAGVTNAKFVSNFKPITYYPDLDKAIAVRKSSEKVRFVFLSRIMPDKGCDYLLEAIQMLNGKGLQDKFIVDFYGKIDGSYQKTFIQKVNKLENVKYKGLLDLRTNKGYDTLAAYHAMLFPTYWKGEGFAGVFIDAFIAGLPVLASDWAYNAEILSGEQLGLVYATHDVTALANTMEKCIGGEIDLIGMAKRARTEAVKYQADRVMTEEYLKSIKLL
jgi:glycosyltransferase involved in cell wall biosynthesis